MTQVSPDTMIRDQAAYSFRRSPEAIRALRWFKDSPQEFEKICQEFDEIIKNMNFILKGDESINQNNFGAVARLKEGMVNRLLSLVELAELVGKDKNINVLEQVMKTFTEVGAGLGEGGKWSWAREELPRVMASGLLIEAYGNYLAQGHGSEAVKRDFVLGFEETGWAFARNSGIMQDVKPWMLEEADGFSPNVRKEL